MTIRELINQYQTEVKNGNLMPDRAAEIMTEVASILGNINDQITKCDMEYNQVLLNCLETEKSANKAKIKAGITNEYKAMRDARNTEKSATELIRSLKFYLKVRESEYNNTKYI